MSLEFLEDTHTYLLNGIVTPSVSTILRDTIFKDKYKNIPDFILQRAAAHGTAIHAAIEFDDDSNLNKEQKKSFNEWKELKKTFNIKPKKQEIMIHYKNQYAGTFDMLATLNDMEVLIDIKTTYRLDLKYLSWQLSMYAMAYGFKGDLYAVWLPKKTEARVVRVPRIKDEDIKKLLEDYNALQENRDGLEF